MQGRQKKQKKPHTSDYISGAEVKPGNILRVMGVMTSPHISTLLKKAHIQYNCIH